MPIRFRTTHRLVLSGNQYRCIFLQTAGNLYQVTVDPGTPIEDGSQFTIIPDENENVYAVVAGTIMTIPVPNTNRPDFKTFNATKQNGP